MKQKIGVIGHFGGGRDFFEGQTIKTKTVQAALEKYCAEDFELLRTDTYYLKHNAFRFVFQFFRCMRLCDAVIVLLSKKGRKVLFPVLWLYTRLFDKKIFHCAIGGRLADEAQNRRVKKYICSFEANWVESKELASRLKSMGVSNAEYLPNFKLLEAIDTENISDNQCLPYRFCTFSRVMREKGISDAINAIHAVNKECGSIAELHIYGAIEPSYIEEFKALLGSSDNGVVYKGTVLPQDSVKVLSDYYMLLFPTHWQREGIPGTVIDALASGLPVIARKWKYCDEMLEHGLTGYCYPFDAPEELEHWIKTAITHESDIGEMRRNCFKRSEEYGAERCAGMIARGIKDCIGEK